MSARLEGTRHRYELSNTERAALTSELRPDLGEPASGMRAVAVSGDDPRSDLAREVERSVLHETFGEILPHTSEVMFDEYGDYEAASTFFIAVAEQDLSVVGVLRVIRGPKNKSASDLRGTSSEADDWLRQHCNPTERTDDIGTATVAQVVPSSVDRSSVGPTLYRALYKDAIDSGVVRWTTVVDSNVLPIFDHIGVPFKRIPGVPELDYLGSTAVACFAEIEEIEPSAIARRRLVDPYTQKAIGAMLYGSDSLPETGPALKPVIDLRNNDPHPKDQTLSSS